MPDFSARKRYRVERDISYGEHGERNMLDVWRRRDVAPDAQGTRCCSRCTAGPGSPG